MLLLLQSAVRPNDGGQWAVAAPVITSTPAVAQVVQVENSYYRKKHIEQENLNRLYKARQSLQTDLSTRRKLGAKTLPETKILSHLLVGARNGSLTHNVNQNKWSS